MQLLVIDTGSSSMRGTLLDDTGKASFSVSRQYKMETAAGGKSEMNPVVFQAALTDICQQVAAYAADCGLSIAALSLTSQRSSVLALDRDGRPLGPILTWQDKRSAAICDEANRKDGDMLYGICGTRLTPVASAPKMVLLRQMDQTQFDRADKLVGIHDYLLALLTGLPSTDTSLASRTCLMDIRTGTWSDTLLRYYDIPREKLCRLLAPGSVAGDLQPSFAAATGLCAGIPVITAGGDQQCSVLGQGITAPGEAGITLGTGAYACMLITNPPLLKEATVNISAAVLAGHWIAEASTFSSGLVYDWLDREFSPPEAIPYHWLNRAICDTPMGANQVIALPYLTGKGAPEWNPYAKGCFLGLGPDSTRADMARATLEGLLADVADCCTFLFPLGGGSPREVTVCGGLSKFDTASQMLSDMLALPVAVPKIPETTVLGAWAVAAATLGWQPDAPAAIRAANEKIDRTVFVPDCGRHHFYRRQNEVRKTLYRSIPFHILQP